MKGQITMKGLKNVNKEEKKLTYLDYMNSKLYVTYKKILGDSFLSEWNNIPLVIYEGDITDRDVQIAYETVLRNIEIGYVFIVDAGFDDTELETEKKLLKLLQSLRVKLSRI